MHIKLANAEPAVAPIDREDFRDAIGRRRASAWRVTVACVLAYAVLAFVVAILSAPVLYGSAGLVLDLVNLVVPAPDLLGFLWRWFSFKTGPASLGKMLATYGFAALPGLVVFALAALSLRRTLLLSSMFRPGPMAGITLGRPADPTRLAEVQFVNTVEEMAIAAIIPVPRVAFVDGSLNAASLGTDIDRATIVVGAGLTDFLSRAQMQGVAAFLVGSIANGDMRVGMQMTLALGIAELVGRLCCDWQNDESYSRPVMRLLRALAAPNPGSLSEILAILSSLLNAGGKRTGDERVAERETWRGWRLLLFMGLFMNGMLAKLVSSIVLGSLVGFAWRQRKYMADATAVELTRDPDNLDGALSAIANAGASIALPDWAGHLCIVQPLGGKDLGSVIADKYGSVYYPSTARRHRALMRLGATSHRASSEVMAIPIWKWLIGGLLATAFVGLFVMLIGLMFCASVLFSLMLTIGPAFAVHYILRSLLSG